MKCECNISVDFPACDSNIDAGYCGVEVPVSSIIFVDQFPEIGDKDQLYVINQSIYRWSNEDLQFIPIAGEDFLIAYFANPFHTIVFDGGNADVTLAILDDTILL